MKEAIAKVEKRGEELNDDDDSESSPQISSLTSYRYALQDAAGASKDRQSHTTFEVGFEPICQIDVPELVSSDASSCSDRNGEPSSTMKAPPEQQILPMATDVSSLSAPTSAPPSDVQLNQEVANQEVEALPAGNTSTISLSSA